MSFYIVQGDILERNVDAIVVSVAPNLELEQGYLQKKVKKICGKKLKYEMAQLKLLMSRHMYMALKDSPLVLYS